MLKSPDFQAPACHCYPRLSGSGGRSGPRKTKAPGVTRHNCVMSYLNRRRCASGPGAEISCRVNDRPGLVHGVITQNAGLASNHPQDTRDTEERGIQDNLEVKLVIESFINKRVSCDLFEVKRGFWLSFIKCSAMSGLLHWVKHTHYFPICGKKVN